MDNDKPTPKVIWSRLGGQLGVGLCAIGFLLVFLGWNGAASVDRIPSQFPYLISGGVAGLCFVVLGVGMLVVQNQRTDRAALQASLRELQDALERGGLARGTEGERRTFARPGPRPPEPSTVATADTAQVHVPAVAETPTATAPRRTIVAKATKTAKATKASPRRRTTG